MSAAERASGANAGSAGLLVYRRSLGGPQVLLVHPGGPYWRGKDLRAWSFPKGHIGPDEEPLAAARREFREETGLEVDGPFLPLSPVKRSRGGLTFCWMAEADLDLSKASSNSGVTWTAILSAISTLASKARSRVDTEDIVHQSAMR